MKNHKHYELAYRAHSGTSFSPEKRAEMECRCFDDEIKNLKELAIPQAKIEKYESLWIKHMSAKSRCMSTMITGGSNFNVSRNDKMNGYERNASQACMDYYNKIVEYAKKEAYYEANPHARPVMSGDSDALERLKSKLDSQIKAHETMKACNKIVRKKPIDRPALVKLLGSEERVEQLLKPNYMGAIGFEGFELTNSNARIKSIKDRIKSIESKKEQGDKEIEVNGVKVVQNSEDMRIQIFFDGKPNDETRKMLKSNAFKWAPSKGAWQRQLTNNAIYSFNKFVLPELKKMEA